MANEYVINPETGRKVKVGGRTYKALLANGVISENESMKSPRRSGRRSSSQTLGAIRKECASKKTPRACKANPDCRWGKLFGEERCMKARVVGKERIKKQNLKEAAAKRAKQNPWLAFVRAYWEALDGQVKYGDAIKMAKEPYAQFKALVGDTISVAEARRAGAKAGAEAGAEAAQMYFSKVNNRSRSPVSSWTNSRYGPRSRPRSRSPVRY